MRTWALLMAIQALGAAPGLVDVTETGAVANDGKDDTGAVLAAIERCRTENQRGVLFPKGRYDFFAGANPASGNVSIVAAGFDGFTLDGQGSAFIYHGVTAPFIFDHCQNLLVRDFSIDWERPPFSVGEVIASAEKHFDVEIFEEFPVEGGEPVGAFMDFDPETKLPRRHGLDVYNGVERTELIAPQVLRVFLSRSVEVPVGVRMVLRHEVYGHNALVASSCRGVKVQDVTVYTAPGMGFIGNQSEDIELERFRVLLKPGTRRLCSTTADGSHFGGCTGYLRIKNCIFEGMGDDAVNAKAGLYLTTQEQIDERTVLAAHNLRIPSRPDVGDSLELTPPSTLIPYGSAVVAEVGVEPDGYTCRIAFEEPLPERYQVGDLLGNESHYPKVHITDCTVRRNRARGFLIQTRGATVENCTFEDVTGGGIWAIAEVTHFFECLPAQDLVIRGNTFTHCGYGAALGPGVIGVFAWLKGFADPPEPGVFRNIHIENNTIRQTDNAGIFMSGVEDAVIRGNSIEQACSMITRPEHAGAISILSSRDVLLEGNTAKLEAQGKDCKAPLLIGKGCNEAAITRKDNAGF